MTHIANKRSREYHSELRARQAEQTRARILDAAIVVMARGVASLSIPAVAREARVSVPTVYRHFATKGDLLAAIYPHIVRRAGLDEVGGPRGIDDFRAWVRRLFERTGSLDDIARAAIASPSGDEARRLSIPNRFASAQAFVGSVAPDAAPDDRDRIARMLVVMTSTSAQRILRDHLGRSVGEAADDIDWLLRRTIARARP